MPCPAIQPAATAGKPINAGSAPATSASTTKPAAPAGTVTAMACMTVPVTTPLRNVALLRANVSAARPA